jgi:hypothetical protein
MEVRYDVNFLDYNYAFNGSGVAVGDLNGDGLEDIFFGGNTEPDRLYINLGGMRFRDATAESGIKRDNGWTTGVSMADVNADGHLDIYVCRAWHLHTPEARKDLMYINDGHGHFSERGAEMGLADTSFSSMACFFDADADGDLDLYLVTHPIDFEDKYEYTNHLLIESGKNLSDHFYKNDGTGHFEESHKAHGINNHGYGLGIGVGHFNADRRPDLYVSNDFSMHDQVWVNMGHGQFADSTSSMLRKMSYYGMGVDIADLDGDLLPDILVADMGLEVDSIRKTFMYQVSDASFNDMLMSGYLHQYARNTLQMGTGKGYFMEVANLARMARTGWSWSPLMFDMDQDGRRDVFISNGYFLEFNVDNIIRYGELVAAVRRGDRAEFEKQVSAIRPVQMPDVNRFFLNRGDMRFDEMSESWGLTSPTISHGAAVADLDGDGDLDIVTNNCNSPAAIYENMAHHNRAGPSLLVNLKGPKLNTTGIGAEVRLIGTDGSVKDVAWQFPVRGYWSSSSHRVHFGLGEKIIERVEVIWPDGRVSSVPYVAKVHNLEIAYSGSSEIQDNLQSETRPEPVRTTLDHRHIENRYSDFSARSMLPFGHGRLGPGMAAADVNADGFQDVFIGGAAGQHGSLFIRKSDGSMAEQKGPWTEHAAFEDMGVCMADLDGDGRTDILVANGVADRTLPTQTGLRLYRSAGNGRFVYDSLALQDVKGIFSCIAPHDMDADGDLDLFVGGRHAGPDYPASPRSFLFRNDGNGRFSDVTDLWAKGLHEAGMVSAAVWTPVDGDTIYDLVLVGEWMPVKVFLNRNGRLLRSAASGLNDTEGLWNSVISVDVDGDGDMDLVCGNMGPNTDLTPSVSEPLQLHTADFDHDGVSESILSYVHNGVRTTWRDFQKCAQQLPVLSQRIQTSTEFARLGLNDIYGKPAIDSAHTLSAKTFSSICAINNGKGNFRKAELPWQAQVSSIFGMVGQVTDSGVAVLYSGNFSSTEPDLSRLDAGSGGTIVFNRSGEAAVIDNGSRLWSGEQRSMIAVEGKGHVNVIGAASDEHVKGMISTGPAIQWPHGSRYALVKLPNGLAVRVERWAGGYLSQYDSQPLVGTSQVMDVEFH